MPGRTAPGASSPGAGRQLGRDSLRTLAEVPTDSEPHTVHLPGYGDFRVLAEDVGSGSVVTGLPDSGVDAAGGAAVVLVRRQLEPLHQVARTAHEVRGCHWRAARSA